MTMFAVAIMLVFYGHPLMKGEKNDLKTGNYIFF